MESVRITRMGVSALFIVLLLVAIAVAPSAQTRSQSKQNSDPELEKIGSDCASGRSTLTKQQCEFFVQLNEAMRRVNQLIASGEFGKLPTSTKEAMVALVDVVQTAMPLMLEKQ